MYERSTDSKEWGLTGNGVEVLNKHQIHPMTLYQWGKALKQGAQSFLSGKRNRKDAHTKELEEEIRKLKEALACQNRELMLLKKRMNLV